MLGKLIKSNFKNDLSHMITYFLIMVLAIFMLHTGLAIFLGYRTLHKDKQEKYNFADLMVHSILKPEDNQAIEEIIRNAEYIEAYEKTYPIYKEFKKVKAGAEEDSKNMYDMSSNGLTILPYGGWGELEAPHFVEVADEEYENPIYLSYFINENLFKSKLGDSVDVKVGEKYYTFQVAGFFESLISSEMGLCYVSPSLYNEWNNELYNQLKQNKEQGDEPLYTRVFFAMKLKDNVDSNEASGLITKAFREHNISAYATSVDNTINDFTYMQNMIAALIAAFAIVITGISMIIIYFRIANSIEQNIVNIGALKSIGYTSQQIRLSMVIEFATTTLLAFAAGVVASYLVLPIFEQKIRSFSGVAWDHPFDPVSFAITFVIIIGTVVIVSFVSTRMITKLDPVIALRFGINTHSFKKNHAPIDKTPGPLTWIMALKSVLGNTKQNIILVVVMLSIGIVTTFAVFLTYNCVYDASHLYRMLNLVAADVDVRFKEYDNQVGEIAELPEVESVFWTDSVEMTVNGYTIYTQVTDDWSDISEVNIYEGRSPKYDNETAIGGNLAKTLNVGIGDEIKVSYGQKDYTYLVTGFEQSAGNYGMDITLTTEGAKHLDFTPFKSSVGVYVKGHSLENSVQLVKDLKDMYGDKLEGYGNAIETLKNGDEAVILVASAMVAAMVVVSILVIVLSLNLLVKTMIIKKQREIGIKKALGFSSSQLRTELVLSMLPQIAVGAAVGSVVGSLTSNKILATLLSTMGIMRSNMEIFPWMVFVSIAFALITSFILIWFMSGKIKYISAYSLITE
ncbi:MAG: FtsX-like permease family protein [Eubacterium sp.]|nr:FtsX-like permease family protein [Eubacterium sp.]